MRPFIQGAKFSQSSIRVSLLNRSFGVWRILNFLFKRFWKYPARFSRYFNTFALFLKGKTLIFFLFPLVSRFVCFVFNFTLNINNQYIVFFNYFVALKKDSKFFSFFHLYRVLFVLF